MKQPNESWSGGAEGLQRLGVRLAGSGRALPCQAVSSEACDRRAGVPQGTLRRATGIAERRFCQDETQMDLAVSAARDALDDAAMVAQSVDLVIFAASVPFQSIPATAPLLMSSLGMVDGAAAAFDVNSTCLSFVTGVETAALHLSAGLCQTALVVSSEVASRALPWDTDPETAALFGDGAAAFVLSAVPCDQNQLKRAYLRTYPSAYDACALPAGGTRISARGDPDAFARHALFGMDGKALFRITSRHFAQFADQFMDDVGWSKDMIDLVVPHQASPAALGHLARQLGFARDKIVDIGAEHGNQVAASLPFAFDLARKAGRMPPGSRVLCLGTSAGVSFGGMAIEV